MWAAPVRACIIPGACWPGTFGEAPTVTTFTEVGICGDILRLTMPAGASLRVDSAFAYRVHCENGGAVEELRALRPDPAAFDADLAALIQAEEAKSGGLTMTFEDGKEDSLSAEVMNAFVEQLKKQVEFAPPSRAISSSAPDRSSASGTCSRRWRAI